MRQSLIPITLELMLKKRPETAFFEKSGRHGGKVEAAGEALDLPGRRTGRFT